MQQPTDIKSAMTQKVHILRLDNLYTMTHLNWANSRMQQHTDTKAAMTQKLHTFRLDNLYHDTFTRGQGQDAAMH